VIKISDLNHTDLNWPTLHGACRRCCVFVLSVIPRVSDRPTVRVCNVAYLVCVVCTDDRVSPSLSVPLGAEMNW